MFAIKIPFLFVFTTFLVKVSDCESRTVQEVNTDPVIITNKNIVKELHQPCIKSVNASILPSCQITFREEGTFSNFNATCLEDNVFLIKTNRTKPEISETQDHNYFSTIFEEQMPPYARISCTSIFPTNFDFEGVGALDFFRIWKGYENNRTFRVNVEVLLSPDATGKYVFYSITDPKMRTTIFIFSERGIKPYLIGDNRVISAVKLNSSATVLPCIASDLSVNVTLYKVMNQLNWIKLNISDNIQYDRQQGFILQNSSGFSLPGDYRCFSESPAEVNSADNRTNFIDDFVTVHVKSSQEEQLSNKTVTSIAFDINASRAACYSTVNKTNLHFSNAYTQNPTESLLLIQCLQRQNAYCGSHSYHMRREGRKISRRCPKNYPICKWITDVHPQGIFYCEDEDTGESIFKEYFTGLDGKFYDTSNISAVAMNSLIKPRFTIYTVPVNITSLKTGVQYEIFCDTVGLIFIRDPFIISVKYKNGSVLKLADMIWWEGPKRSYLTPDMIEIICNDSMWRTHEPISAGTKINVTDEKCEPNHFKCKNGQCVLENIWCDGYNDCVDESDENNCWTHQCKSGLFKCTRGTCVPENKKCNNINDCTDASDESIDTCTNVTCNWDEQFKCTSGQCVHLLDMCDNKEDCFDKSDEAKGRCAEYNPKILQTKTSIKFNLYKPNELICEISPLPSKLKPDITWWRNGQNVTDADRLWQDIKHLRLALRFQNVSEEDAGDYKCVVGNKFQTVEQTFKVEVLHPEPEPDMTCLPDLNKWDCQKRRCIYVRKGSCMNKEDTTTTESPTLATTKPTLETTPTTISTTSTVATSEPLKGGDHSIGAEHSTVGVTIGVSVLIVAVITLLVVSGLRWRILISRTLGLSRRDDQERVLGNIQIQLQNTNNL